MTFTKFVLKAKHIYCITFYGPESNPGLTGLKLRCCHNCFPFWSIKSVNMEGEWGGIIPGDLVNLIVPLDAAH